MSPIIRAVVRGHAIGVIIVALGYLLCVGSSQARFKLMMSGYNTPSPTATSTPTGCLTIPGTGTQVGAACFPPSSCPATDAFPHDPFSFLSPTTSCTTDGTGECSAAISQAIAAGVAQGGHGDIKFSHPGTYLVNLTAGGTYVNTNGITPPANEIFECTVPGVVIKNTLQIPSSSAAKSPLLLQNGHNTVCGCDFEGGQTGSPPFNSIPGTSGASMLLQLANNTATNDLIEGNIFGHQFGNSAIQLNSAGPSVLGPSNETIKFNTFQNGPLYSVNIDSQVSSVVVNNNIIQDEWIGAEYDSCPSGGSVGTATFKNNYLVAQFGMCAQLGNPQCTGDGLTSPGGPGYVPVGTAPSPNVCNYNGIIIGGSSANANYCTSVSSIPAGYGFTNNNGNGTATVSGNIVDTGCICHNASC